MHCEVFGSQTWPAPQQAVQPHSVVPDGHSAAQVPLTQVEPHAHGGLHGFDTHVLAPSSPTWQVCPVGHDVQVPPQPSDFPHEPAGQLGVQHLPPVHASPDGQPQKPPQPSVPEPHELLSQ